MAEIVVSVFARYNGKNSVVARRSYDSAKDVATQVGKFAQDCQSCTPNGDRLWVELSTTKATAALPILALSASLEGSLKASDINDVLKYRTTSDREFFEAQTQLRLGGVI